MSMMKVSFHLYFPGEPETLKAAEALKADGYEVETRPSADLVEWIAVASGSIDEKDFDAVEKRMDAFASSHGGRFDGYEEGG